MKIGVLGMIVSDLANVDIRLVRRIGEMGFHGTGAHLTVTADQIPLARALEVKQMLDDQGIEFVQLWGPYPCIICPDEGVRREGIAKAQEVVKLAAKMGAHGAGIRPTSLNPHNEWGAHPANYTPATQDVLVQSLRQIAQTAADEGIDIVLECHTTTTLNTPKNVRHIIERTESPHVKTNLDPVNFVGDLQTAFNTTALVEELFAELRPYIATAHIKDLYLEERFVVHISEAVPGTGIMDIDTTLLKFQELMPQGYVFVEHLPVGLIAMAKQNLTAKIKALGIPIGGSAGGAYHLPPEK